MTGRQKQTIIRGGRNIDINEMEAAIARVPGIVQVCVVAVPDELLGERAAALVVTGGEALALNSVTDQLAAADVPKFKWPEYLFTVKDLPQNRVGKLSRPDAAQLASRLRVEPSPRRFARTANLTRVHLESGRVGSKRHHRCWGHCAHDC